MSSRDLKHCLQTVQKLLSRYQQQQQRTELAIRKGKTYGGVQDPYITDAIQLLREYLVLDPHSLKVKDKLAQVLEIGHCNQEAIEQRRDLITSINLTPDWSSNPILVELLLNSHLAEHRLTNTFDPILKAWRLLVDSSYHPPNLKAHISDIIRLMQDPERKELCNAKNTALFHPFLRSSSLDAELFTQMFSLLLIAKDYSFCLELIISRIDEFKICAEWTNMAIENFEEILRATNKARDLPLLLVKCRLYYWNVKANICEESIRRFQEELEACDDYYPTQEDLIVSWSAIRLEAVAQIYYFKSLYGLQKLAHRPSSPAKSPSKRRDSYQARLVKSFEYLMLSLSHRPNRGQPIPQSSLDRLACAAALFTLFIRHYSPAWLMGEKTEEGGELNRSTSNARLPFAFPCDLNQICVDESKTEQSQKAPLKPIYATLKWIMQRANELRAAGFTTSWNDLRSVVILTFFGPDASFAGVEECASCLVSSSSVNNGEPLTSSLKDQIPLSSTDIMVFLASVVAQIRTSSFIQLVGWYPSKVQTVVWRSLVSPFRDDSSELKDLECSDLSKRETLAYVEQLRRPSSATTCSFVGIVLKGVFEAKVGSCILIRREAVRYLKKAIYLLTEQQVSAETSILNAEPLFPLPNEKGGVAKEELIDLSLLQELLKKITPISVPSKVSLTTAPVLTRETDGKKATEQRSRSPVCYHRASSPLRLSVSPRRPASQHVESLMSVSPMSVLPRPKRIPNHPGEGKSSGVSFLLSVASSSMNQEKEELSFPSRSLHGVSKKRDKGDLSTYSIFDDDADWIDGDLLVSGERQSSIRDKLGNRFERHWEALERLTLSSSSR